jgi:hypothetical protein
VVQLISRRQQIRAQAEANEAFMDVESAFPPNGEATEVVQQAEGLLDDVAQLAKAIDSAPYRSREVVGRPWVVLLRPGKLANSGGSWRAAGEVRTYLAMAGASMP